MFLEIKEGTKPRRKEYNEQNESLEKGPNINSKNEKNNYKNKNLKQKCEKPGLRSQP